MDEVLKHNITGEEARNFFKKREFENIWNLLHSNVYMSSMEGRQDIYLYFKLSCDGITEQLKHHETTFLNNLRHRKCKVYKLELDINQAGKIIDSKQVIMLDL